MRDRIDRLPIVMLIALSLMLGGCNREQPAQRSSTSGLSSQQRSQQANALFRTITSQLALLPEATQLQLRPPTVLHDSRNSSNGEDVMATVTRQPGTPLGGPSNLLKAKNARFRQLDIRSGDQIKFYATYDEETQRRLKETGDTGFATLAAINLSVAQVLDDNTLIIADGLNGEVKEPKKIEIWRNVDDQMNAISSRLGRYAERRDPPLAWRPAPDDNALNPLVDRLNQWLRQGAGAAEQSEAVAADRIATLPEDLRKNQKLAPMIASQTLASGAYSRAEVRRLQVSIWLRDVGRWVLAKQQADAESVTDSEAEAQALFDWAVCNISLKSDEKSLPRSLWGITLFGEGSVADRAWVFVELCRQRRLPVEILELPPTEGQPAYLLVGVQVERGLLLFDPKYGLALRDGLQGPIATLDELSQDATLLRSWDQEDTPYPVDSERLAGAQRFAVADPFMLTERAARLQSKLSGDDRLVLSLDQPGAEKLWPHPFAALAERLSLGPGGRNREVKAFLPFAWRPHLWKARVLHLRGKLEEPGDDNQNVLAQGVYDHRQAQQLYMHRTVRPRKDRLTLDKIGSEIKREIYQQTKARATLWLGVVSYEEGRYENALRWFENSVLESRWADPLQPAVHYLRARTYEAMGETDKAVELLQQSESPQQAGDQLRARWLATR